MPNTRDLIGFTILFALFAGMMIALLPGAIDGEIAFREAVYMGRE